MGVDADQAAVDMVDAIDAELLTPKGAEETWYAFRVRLKQAEINALWDHVEANARITVQTTVTGSVDQGIPVAGTPLATTAPGSISNDAEGNTDEGTIT